MKKKKNPSIILRKKRQARQSKAKRWRDGESTGDSYPEERSQLLGRTPRLIFGEKTAWDRFQEEIEGELRPRGKGCLFCCKSAHEDYGRGLAKGNWKRFDQGGMNLQGKRKTQRS